MTVARPAHGPLATGSSRLGVAALLVLAAAVRFWHLGTRGLWTDEGSTWTAVTAPLRELVRLCAQKDASPPLFYLLTSLSMRLGGSEAHLRAVAALASVGLVWLTYRVARICLPRGESALAAAITAVSPFQLMYAQEARTYTLAACFAVWSLYLFLRLLLSQRRKSWVPYVIVTALGLYTQSIVMLSIGVQAAIILLTRSGRRRLVPWLASVGIAGVLYLPWSLVSLAQMAHLGQSHWYLRTPDERGLFHVIRAVFLSPIPLVTPPAGSPVPGLDHWIPRGFAQLLLVAIPALPLSSAMLTALDRGRRGTFIRAIVMAMILPMVVVLAVSGKLPLWLPRYFVLLTPFFAILMAHGLATLGSRPVAIVWGAALFLASAYACVRYELDYTKERWRDVVHTIEMQSPTERTAVLVPFDVDAFRFYNSRLEHPVTAFEVSHPEVPFASGYTQGQLDLMERQAQERTRDFDEVWVVVRSPNSHVRKEVVARTNHAAEIGRHRVTRLRWDAVGGPVWGTRYVRDGAVTDSAGGTPAF